MYLEVEKRVFSAMVLGNPVWQIAGTLADDNVS